MLWPKSKKKILKEINEPHRLPMGRIEFDIWADRIIRAAAIPGATLDSQRATLAGTIMHLGPTESHKPDAFFIHTLIKLAANQVAHAMFQELRALEKERLQKEEQQANETKVLPNKEVSGA